MLNLEAECFFLKFIPFLFNLLVLSQAMAEKHLCAFFFFFFLVQRERQCLNRRLKFKIELKADEQQD